jgi:hypothetical protein
MDYPDGGYCDYWTYGNSSSCFSDPGDWLMIGEQWKVKMTSESICDSYFGIAPDPTYISIV